MRQQNNHMPALQFSSTAGPAVSAPSSIARLTFLVAEDDEFTARLIEQLLTRQGHHVHVAGNGRDVLQMAAEVVTDMVLLDIHLPILDGFQVVRRIRERERLHGGHRPVIALTASSSIEDRQRCLAAGMDGFLAKPIKVARLWSAVQHAMGALSSPVPDDSDLIDGAALLAASGNREENLQELCKQFLAGLPVYLTGVQEAYRRQDATQLSLSAHRLSGMLSACSERAAAVASEIEDKANRTDFREMGPLISHLNEICGDLLKKMSRVSLARLRRETGQ